MAKKFFGLNFLQWDLRFEDDFFSAEIISKNLSSALPSIFYLEIKKYNKNINLRS